MDPLGSGSENTFLSAPHLERLFPALRTSFYGVTSAQTTDYNCIAWAAGDNSKWWWPGRYSYWPASVANEETLTAFAQAYATLGYENCVDESLEPGFEKVAIFTLNGVPTHAALQLKSGMWTSKLGDGEDIAHTLAGVSGKVYGKVAAIVKRPRSK